MIYEAKVSKLNTVPFNRVRNFLCIFYESFSAQFSFSSRCHGYTANVVVSHPYACTVSSEDGNQPPRALINAYTPPAVAL